MSDLGPITRKLAALASGRPVFRSGLRVLSNGVFPPPLPAILEEVDATVLRRQVTLHAGDSQMTLIVAGRRILCVTGLSDDLAEGQAAIGRPLSQDDPEGLEMTGALLAAFAEGARAVLVDSVPVTSGGAAVGISAAHLAELLDLGETPRPVQLFIEACEPFYSACLFRSGGLWIGHSDDPALLERLRGTAETQADRLRPAYAAEDDQPGEVPHLIVLERAMEGNLSVSATWAQDDFAIFTHDDGDAAAIHDTWRRIFTL